MRVHGGGVLRVVHVPALVRAPKLPHQGLGRGERAGRLDLDPALPTDGLVFVEDCVELLDVLYGAAQDLDPTDLLLVCRHRDVGLELVEALVDLLDAVALTRIATHGLGRGGGGDGVALLGVEGYLPFRYHGVGNHKLSGKSQNEVF